MEPSDVASWIPVIRDIIALLGGVILGVLGIYQKNLSLATLGFAVAGFGAWGRSVVGMKNGEG